MINTAKPEPRKFATILVLASTYPRWSDDHEPGFVHELAKRLVTQFRVMVLCPHAPGAASREIMDGVEVHRFRYAPARLETLVQDGGIVNNLRRSPWKYLLLPGFFLSQYWAARRLLREHKFSIVHAHWLIPQGLTAWMLSRSRVAPPYVITSHGGDLFALRGKSMSAIKRRVASGAAAMTVVSSAMREEAERLGARPDHLRVIPMGVDFTARFQPNPSVQRDACHLLSVGRLVPKKGLHVLLHAMPEIGARHPEVKLTIIGFGPEEARLRALTSQLGLDASVEFIGALPQEQLVPYYQRATAFIAPYVQAPDGDRDGLPVALMEAIACECPVVTTAMSGIEDLLGTEAPRFRVPPGDAPRFAEAICALLDSDETERRALASARRSRVVGEFDWSSVVNRYAKVLDSVSRNRIH